MTDAHMHKHRRTKRGHHTYPSSKKHIRKLDIMVDIVAILMPIRMLEQSIQSMVSPTN